MSIKTLDELRNKYKVYFTQSNLLSFLGWACPFSLLSLMIYTNNTESVISAFAIMCAASMFVFRFKSEVPEEQELPLDEVLSIGKAQGYSPFYLEQIEALYAQGASFCYGSFLIAHANMLINSMNNLEARIGSRDFFMQNRT